MRGALLSVMLRKRIKVVYSWLILDSIWVGWYQTIVVSGVPAGDSELHGNRRPEICLNDKE